MKNYFTKILIIYGGLFSVVNFGWIISTFYLMSNSPEQMRVFSTQGFLIWLCCFIIGMVIMTVITKPVSDGLARIEQGTLADLELPSLSKANSILPLLAGLVILVMTTIFDIFVYLFYMKYDIGPVASTGLWATNIAANGMFVVIMYGSCSLVTNPVINVFKRECKSRGVGYAGSNFSLQAKLSTLMVLFVTSCIAWVGMIGYYEQIYRIQEDLKEGLISSQKVTIARLHKETTAPDLGTLKTVVDDLTNAGVGKAFLADRQGNIIYNPTNTEVYNNTWEDINKTIRGKISSAQQLSIYENVHEQVIASLPVDENFSIGVVRRMQEKMANFNQFWIMFLLLMIIGFSTIGIAVATLIRSIAIPVQKAVQKLKEISSGEGDLTARLSIRSNDETGILAEEFNAFVAKLEKMIGDMKNIAVELDRGTQEVATGTQQLSQSTQSQASSIEQFAATVEEIASTIKNTSSNAENGRDKVRRMVELASITGEVSKDLVRSMAEISDSSRKIGSIISTVNQVAFQTNLLALNAAVEAARAGEHGKGFAVVATEVRALAQNSAEAAKQIKDLIEDTTSKILAGDEKVKRSEESLRKIIALIEELSNTMEEIASASLEQASGVDELNKSITQIDNNIQLIASTTEELAGTSDTLNTEAKMLAEHVDHFKVSGPE